MSAPRRMSGTILAGLFLAATSLAQAPDRATREDLARVEEARDAAQERLEALERDGEQAVREASEIEADLLAAAADSRRREGWARASEARIVELEQEAAIARNLLDQDESAREDLLAALMMLGSRPPPALAASPEDAGSAIRAAILMGDAAPELGRRAATLRDRIDVLAQARAQIAAEQETLRRSEQALAARRAEIEALAREKRLASEDLAVQTEAMRQEAARLSREAEDLRALLEGLAKSELATVVGPSRPGGADGLPIGPAMPRTAPALGDVVRVFGNTETGLTLSTRTGAQIVSPGDARVAFADDFRSYGRMLILDVGSDELVILSGLDVLYPEAGQWVLAGEPVGRMADRNNPAPELYVEVRRAGTPVDPADWLDRGI